MSRESYDAPYVMGIIAEYQNDFDGAREWYQKALSRNPNTNRQGRGSKALKNKINRHPEIPVTPDIKSTEDRTESVDRQLKKVRFHKSTFTFTDVVGMDKQKKLIYENIILAIKKPKLLKATARSLASGDIYGPPGCGKT